MTPIRTSATCVVRATIAALALVVASLGAVMIPSAHPAAADTGSVIVFNEPFDSVAAPALPAGWTASLATGQSGDLAWRTGAPAVTTYPNAAIAAAPSHVTDNRLTSPAFVPAPGSELILQQHVWLQDGYDGGVLDIKIGNGSWVDFVAAGGVFTQDGYDATIASGHGSPIAGRRAWTGMHSNGTGPRTYATNATMPASAAGQSTQLRWRLATDSSLGGGGFWHVDSVQISSPIATVTINQAATQADPTTASTVSFTAVFSSPVAGFTGADVKVDGTAGGTKSVVVTGGPTTYNVAVSGLTVSGSVIASIPQFSVEGRNAASTSTDNVVRFDGPRSVTINQRAGEPDPIRGPIGFDVTFNDPVTGFTAGDVVIGGTAPGAKTVEVYGGPAGWTAFVYGMTGPGTVAASIPANVVAEGNRASTSTHNVVTFDDERPRVTINQATSQPDPTTGSSIAFTAVFSEPVTGFTGSNVVVGGTAPGTKTVAVTGGPTTYNLSVSGMSGGGTVIPGLPAGAAFDTAGNSNLASTSTDNVVTFRATSPQVAINQATSQADPTTGSSIVFTAVFSEAVTGFTGSDVVVGGTAPGTKTVAVTGGPTTYTLAVSGMSGEGTVVPVIPAGQAANGMGIVNAASTSTDNVVSFLTSVRVAIDQATAQGDPTTGSSIVFTAVFSEAVTGFTGSDVVVGGTAPGTKTVAVTGGPTTYTLAVSGMSGEGTVVPVIPAGQAANGMGIVNAASTSTDNVVSYRLPRSSTINRAADQADYTNQSTIRFTVVFGEPVTGFTEADIVITGGAHATTAVVTGGPSTYTVTISGMTAPGSVVASFAADVVEGGNPAPTSTDNSVEYDNVPAQVTINQDALQEDPTTVAVAYFTIAFNKAMLGFTGSDIVLSGTAPGPLKANVIGGPGIYRMYVSGMTGSGTVVATIPAGVAVDGAGNSSAASTSTDNSVQINLHTVTINQATGQADPTKGSPIKFSAVFAFPTTGFTSSDVTITGTAPGAKTVVVSGGPTTFTVAVSGMTGSGTVLASIPANVVDGGNRPATSTDNSVTYDIVAPTATINQASTQTDPSATSPVRFTAAFSEPVTGFTGSDVSFAGTAPGTKTATITGGPTTYTVTVSGMVASGTVVASIPAGRVTDTAGNPSRASTSTDNSVQVNLRTVTINRPADQADPTNGASIRFSVAFSTGVTGFTSSDVTIGGTAPGTKTAVVTGGPSTYTVAVSGMTGPGTVVASLPPNVVDGGNAASTSTDNSVVFDNMAPAVTIEQAASQVDPSATSPVQFTAVFSEPVTGFTGSDVSFAGTAPGTKTAVVTGGPTTYTVTVSGVTSAGTVVASIPTGKVVDLAGNLNAASTSTDNSVQVDLRTVTINQATDQADPTNGATVRFSVVFSTAVTGFTSSDVTLVGTAPGKTAVVTGGPTTFTVAVSGMTASGGVVALLRANVVDGGNAASTSTDNGVSYDIVAPTVTIDQAATQADPTATSPIVFTVAFSEVVTGFDAADMAIAGTAPGTTTAVVTGSGKTYSVAVSGMTGPGTVLASIPAGAAADRAGNPSIASTSTDNSVDYQMPAAP